MRDLRSARGEGCLYADSLVGMNDIRRVFDAAPPECHVKSWIAGEEAPEFDAVHDFDAVALSVPADFLIEVSRDFGAVEVVGVPQALLADRGVEAQFEHVAVFVGVVAAGRVPDVGVPKEYGACFTHGLHLSDDVLVSFEFTFVYVSVLAAGYKESAAAFERGVFWEEAGLDVEVQVANVVFGILMQVGTFAGVCRCEVRCMVVVAWVWTYQAVDDGFDFGQAEDFANCFFGPKFAKGYAHCRAAF